RGGRRAAWTSPAGAMHGGGPPWGGGGAWPVSSPNPLWGAPVAVNRSLPAMAGGQDSDSFLPEQAMGLASILAAYTSGSARVNGLDAVTGSIREGLDVDFAIVNADLACLSAHQVGQALVTPTRT